MHTREGRGPAWRALLALHAGAACVAAIASAASGRCNNYVIFRSAYANLVAGRDLYAAHPAQHLDLFKYSPTFALLFAPIAASPFLVGLIAWNLLNTVPLAIALDRVLPGRAVVRALLLMLLAIALTTDGTQSNGLVAALIVLAFLAFERGRPFGAALAIALGASIKLFPLAALGFAALHRGSARFALLFAAALVGIVALPLAVTGVGPLAAQYASWYRVEMVDALDRGASAMWLLHRWGRVDWPNWPIQLAGTAFLLAPIGLLQRRPAELEFRLRFLASVLVYVVIFNHQAERPSLLLALTGVAIWWTVSPASASRLALAALSFALVVPLLLADASPGSFLAGADPVGLAVFPLAITWAVMQAELLGVSLARQVATEPARESQARS